jgi:hypothetical protein
MANILSTSVVSSGFAIIFPFLAIFTPTFYEIRSFVSADLPIASITVSNVLVPFSCEVVESIHVTYL